MNDLVYPRERTLGTITLVIGLVVWLGLIVGTFGAALIGLALGFVLYLFAQSALIAHIKGNGVELSETQFPDLHKQFTTCCDRLQMKTRPQAYILNGNGGLNAFATKFLGTQFVVLMSDVVDAMDKHADGVRFYIGHELGHLRMKHLSGHLLRWPALWLPLIGAAYSRARETTCDRHGLACSGSPEGAARALQEAIRRLVRDGRVVDQLIADAVSRRAVLTALNDDYRVVRLAATASMLRYPSQLLDKGDAASLDRGLQEYLAMLNSRPDDSYSKYNLGNYTLNISSLLNIYEINNEYNL